MTTTNTRRPASGTDQVCVTCGERISKAPTGAYYHLNVDWKSIGKPGHPAEPKLAHPMDVDPFAGIDEGHGYVPGDVIHDLQAAAALEDHGPAATEPTPIALADLDESSYVYVTVAGDADYQGDLVEVTDTTVTLVDWSRWIMGSGKPTNGRAGQPIDIPLAEITAITVYAEDDDIPVTLPVAEPTFPPDQPEPSISLATFQQRVQAGEWNAASTAETVDALTEPLTATELDTLLDAVNDVPTFAPSPRHRVPAAVVARRRAKNRAARRTRRTNRNR